MKTCSTQPSNWQEARRMRAWELHEQGWKQKDIAAALGVTEGAVSQWMSRGKTQGPEALRHRSSPGAPPPGGPPPPVAQATCPPARIAGTRSRGIRVPRAGLDRRTRGPGDQARIW